MLKWEDLVSQICCCCLGAKSCPPLCDPMDCDPPTSSVHGISQAKNTGGGCHFLLQGIFLTQESNLRLLVFTAEPAGKPLHHSVLHNYLKAGRKKVFLAFKRLIVCQVIQVSP